MLQASLRPRSDRGTLSELARLVVGRPAVVLTGAGCSTESGIPDYRGPDGRLRNRLPMRFQEFMGSAAARARYWSRSMVGWPRFRGAAPNEGHRAIARLEALGAVGGVITQNVDGLHQSAGSRTVLELHGSLARVLCMECGHVEPRDAVQLRLEALNPDFAATALDPRADGDVDLPADADRGFGVPPCDFCGGVLKPDVVFFGESVPKQRVARAWEIYGGGGALLVLGSSLTVFSGRRFVLRAQQEGRPVVIVNEGPTRCDETAALKLDVRLERLLPHLVREIETDRG